MERDPVCGMTVDPAHAAATTDHAGKTYFFCSAGCAAKFRADPEKYLAAPQASPASSDRLISFSSTTSNSLPAAAANSAEYTCPMHPQIVRPGPGSCPICGMALEPRTAVGGRGRKSRARLDDAAILGQRRAHDSRPRARHVRHDSRPARAAIACRCARSAGFSSFSRRRWSSGAVGRSSSAAGRRS